VFKESNYLWLAGPDLLVVVIDILSIVNYKSGYINIYYLKYTTTFSFFYISQIFNKRNFLIFDIRKYSFFNYI